MLLHRTKKLLFISTSVGSHISTSKQSIDPDQAALTRAAWSGSALFEKALNDVSMRYRVKQNPLALNCD